MTLAEDSIGVLFVDDEPDFPDLVATKLEREDERISVLTAGSVDEGLTVLEESAIDCVVADYDMPKRDGIDFLEAVRENHPDLPYILYTGQGSEKIASDAISKGVTDYFQKGRVPNQYTILANRITNAVEAYRSQKSLEERRRELHTYERMVHSMLESACVYDEAAQFKIVNEHLARWYGKSRLELEGTKSKLVPLIQEQYEGDPFQDLFDGEIPKLTGTVDAEFPGHGPAVLEYKLSPLEVDGSIEGVVGVTQEITDRVKREREVTRAYEEYQDLFNGMNDTALVIDPDGEILAVNDAAVETLGYSREEFQSMDPSDIDARFDHEEVQAHIERMPEDETQVFETVHRTKDGEKIPVEISSSLITYQEEPAILSIGRDISSRKEREKRLEQFASVVSHDLRNPLNVAQGRLELARKDQDSEHLEAIERAHERMQTLIEDLLTLAREGEPITSTEPVSLEGAVNASWQSVETPSALLETNLDRSIRADQSRLRQVFENLMRNAMEHDGEDVTVTVGELEDGFYVEDNGSGIPESVREDVFEAGFSTTEKGTGFGLSIVEQIVDAHEWDIRITESADGGARFEIAGVEFVEQ